MGKNSITAQEDYLKKIVMYLSVLRASIRITTRIGKKIGIIRQFMMSIETGKRPLLWSNYLALVLVFNHYEDSKKLMESLKLFDSGVINQQ